MSSSKSSNRPKGNFSRRQFIYLSALAAGATAVPGFAAAPRRVSANEKLNIGAVGCGGKGASDIQFCSGENIVALCDVDARTLAARKEGHPNVTTYQDWR